MTSCFYSRRGGQQKAFAILVVFLLRYKGFCEHLISLFRSLASRKDEDSLFLIVLQGLDLVQPHTVLSLWKAV